MAFRRLIQILFYSSLILAVSGRPLSLVRNGIDLLVPAARIEYPTNPVNNVELMLVPYVQESNYVYYPPGDTTRSALPALPGTQGIAVIGQNIVTLMMGILNAVGIIVRDVNSQDAPAVQE